MDSQRKLKRKKHKKTEIILYGMLLTVTFLLMFTTVILFFFYQAEKEKTIAAMKEIEELSSPKQQEEVKVIEKEIVKEVLVTDSYADETFTKVKELAEEGEGMLTLLQTIYPDEVIVSGDGRYYFFPIQEDLAKNGLNQENFIYPVENEETGSYENEAVYETPEGKRARKGVDVSTFQNEIDWERVKDDGIDYAIIRLGFRGYESGKIVLDARYEENIKGALEAGIDTGVYFFTEAVNEAEAVEEAEFVIENLKGYDINMPVAIDVEKSADPGATRTKDLTAEQRTKNVIAFCERIRKEGYEVMIYGNLYSFMIMMDFEQLEEYDKWFAYYRYPFHFPYKIKMWQYASWEKVDGISGGADVNLMFY